MQKMKAHMEKAGNDMVSGAGELATMAWRPGGRATGQAARQPVDPHAALPTPRNCTLRSQPAGPGNTLQSSRGSTVGAWGLNRSFLEWTNRPGSNISGFGVWPLWAVMTAIAKWLYSADK